MRPRDPLSGLLNAGLVVLAVMGWLVLAPPGVGGSTDYLTTTGDSMAPRFQSGDLALLRPADHYRVGDIVAYRDKLLRTVVLHRIIARDGQRYVFKGDNNDFVDPTHPARADLIGRLWLHVPHVGTVLAWLRTPGVAAVVTGGVALLVLLGTGHHHRRRATRHRQGGHPMARPRPHVARGINAQTVLLASAVAAAVFLVVGLIAITRPTTKAVTVKTPYTEEVSLDYRASAAGARSVYARGVVRTGDPVFLRLVDRLRVNVDYDFGATSPRRIAGTMELLARLTNATGWTRTIQLEPPTRFAGDHADSGVILDLDRLQSLTARVEKLTGAPSGGGYTLAVVPRVRLTGTLAGRPLDSDFAPALRFQLDALQLRPQQEDLAPSRRATVAASTTAPNTLSIRGLGLPVATVRWIALAGLLLVAAGALLAWRRHQRHPADPTTRFHDRYGHLIVPIAGIAHDPARPPVDVTDIEALAQLAERSDRLILHQHHDDADIYLIDGEATLYRYQTRPSETHHPPRGATPRHHPAPVPHPAERLPDPPSRPPTR